jgi:hypothetical protein
MTPSFGAHLPTAPLSGRDETSNPYEAPACQRVKHSLREASGLAHGSSDCDLAYCAPLA